MQAEFDLIERVFKPLCQTQPQEIGIGDDGACLAVPSANQQLVVVTDTLIEGVHFPVGTAPFFIAWKALAVNLSDLAAMGAQPDFYSLAITLPKTANYSAQWFDDLARGFAALNQQFQVRLIGGDTTSAQQLTLTVTAQGWVPKGQALCRFGAQVGDMIAVSGAIGDGGLGLKSVLNQLGLQSAENKLNQPQPQVALGQFLRGRAHSAIDISDGLLADLSHILHASGCGAELYYDQIPFSQALQAHLQGESAVWPLTAGDDYELCFTLPKNRLAELQSAFPQVTPIGQIVAQPNLTLLDAQNQPIPLELNALGFRHF